MALVLTAFQAYAVEIDEPLQKRFIQRAEFDITGANTDNVYDFGTYAGTFWTAVGGTPTGAIGLQAVKNIQVAAKCFLWADGLGLAGKSAISGTGGGTVAYTSAASVGGAATEAVTVTGLGATDTILAVSQVVKGANSTALNGWNTQGANTLTLSWTGNPGAGSQAVILTRKASGAATPSAGQYVLALDGTNGSLPNLTFASGNAPTTAYIVMEWELPNNQWPIQVKSP